MRKAFEVHAWALYDFANTIFAVNMFTLYFALWVTKDMGAPDLAYSTAVSLSLFLVALASPVFGAYSDRIGKRTGLVALFTVLACAAVALLPMLIPLFGKAALVPALILFGVASFAFNLAQVFYNAQLPELVSRDKIGWLSGYGAGIGYLGSFVGILCVMPFVTGKLFGLQTPIPAGGNVGAFIPTALIFLLFALPHHLMVKDHGAPRVEETAKRAWARLWETAKAARQVPGMVRYLVANLLFFDALNTVIGFMAIYAVKVVGFNEQKQEVQVVLLLSTLFAAAGSVLWGKLVDGLGSKRALQLNLALWAVALVGIIFVRDKAVFSWVLGPTIGVAMGGTWASSRALLSGLAPVDRQAEFFGLYSLAGKFAAIIGPMTWGLITYALSAMPVAKYQVAIAAQLVFVLAGAYLLVKVPQPAATRLVPEPAPQP